MINSEFDDTIISINESLQQVYTLNSKGRKPKNFLEKLFALEVTEEPEIVLNPLALTELSNNINENINKLSQELSKFDMLRKYIEVYRKKLNNI